MSLGLGQKWYAEAVTKTKGALSLTVEEIERAKSLFALGRSYRAIGRELGRSAHAVKRLLEKPAVAAEVSVKKIELADLFEQRSRETLEAVTKKDIEGASLLQKATSSAIFLDKCRLIRGESTANLNVTVLMDLAQLIRDQRDEASEDYVRKWREEHSLTLSPVPQPEPPASDPIPVPQPATIQQPTVARYQSAKPISEEVDYSPLMHGLSTANR